jgi:hypothetical protein
MTSPLVTLGPAVSNTDFLSLCLQGHPGAFSLRGCWAFTELARGWSATAYWHWPVLEWRRSSNRLFRGITDPNRLSLGPFVGFAATRLDTLFFELDSRAGILGGSAQMLGRLSDRIGVFAQLDVGLTGATLAQTSSKARVLERLNYWPYLGLFTGVSLTYGQAP